MIIDEVEEVEVRNDDRQKYLDCLERISLMCQSKDFSIARLLILKEIKDVMK